MKYVTLTILSLILMISCKSSSHKTSDTENRNRIHDSWTVVRINGNPVNRMVKVPKLEINTAEMKVNGNDGCNTYFGSISELTNQAITLSNIGSTKMMCPAMEIPDSYLSAMLQVSKYDFQDDVLIMTDTNDRELLAFIKME